MNPTTNPSAERVPMVRVKIQGTEYTMSLNEANTLGVQLSNAVQESIGLFGLSESQRIKGIVASAFGLTVDELDSDTRKERIVIPRQIAMCLHRQMTDMSLEEIGLAFQKPDGSGRDHGTVLHACKAMDGMMTQPGLKRAIERIKAALKQPSGKESE